MNDTSTASKTPLYQSGFGNHFQSEAVAGALPRDQNSPQLAPLGLYPEQFSATAFTVPRVENRFSWLYRIRPAAMHTPFERLPHAALDAAREGRSPTSPSQLRWGSLAMPTEATDFIQGLVVYATSPEGMVMLYAANADMQSRYCYSSDGEWLIVPQAGRLRIATEFGVMEVPPLHIAVIPRGVRFCVSLPDGAARGYICENAGQLFRLPDLGPIGANGLAHARHFESPVADFEDVDRECEIIAKHDGVLWRAGQNHSPLDVVAWHGTLAPYRYDLTRFNTINTVSYDHPDPSIFTVLTSPSGHQGTANIDFVIFPPRWMVAENTFRPPYFHRNVMSEFMGLITGVYDAKEEGFVPGGASLHNRMSAHGPDVSTYEKASAATLAPHKIDGTMAFMFETCHLWRPTEYAANAPQLQASYSQCWQGFRRGFAKSSSVTGLNH